MSFDVIFSTISYTKIVCAGRTKDKPLPLSRFCSPFFVNLNKGKYLFFFAFVGPSFSATIKFLKIKEGVKIHSTD